MKDSCNYISEDPTWNLIWPPTIGKQYYGRGAMMIKTNMVYGSFSDIAYYGGLNDRSTLLLSPNDLARDGFLAIASAMWVYMTPISPLPSMHDLMTGFYEPSTYDINVNIVDGFGATINVISNNGECDSGTGQETSAASDRIAYFEEFCQILGCLNVENTGCAFMGEFNENSASYYPNEWFAKGTNENECEQSSSVTGYSLYATRDYMRCVCDAWGQNVTSCLTEVPDPETPTGALNGVASAMLVFASLLASMTL